MKQSNVAYAESALARIVESLPRVDWLDDDRFAFLKKEIGSIAAPIGSDAVLREVLSFILAGDNFSAAFLVVQSTRLTVREAIDLLMHITKELGRVIVQGYKNLEKEGRVPRSS